jgi:hypothetical protein
MFNFVESIHGSALVEAEEAALVVALAVWAVEVLEAGALAWASGARPSLLEGVFHPIW